MYDIAYIEPMLKKIDVSDVGEIEDCEQLLGDGARYFSLLSVEAGLVPVQPTACSVPSPVVKLPQHNANHSLPFTAEIKMNVATSSLPHTPSSRSQAHHYVLYLYRYQIPAVKAARM